MNIPVGSQNYVIANGASSELIPVFQPRDPTENDLNGSVGPFKLQQRWVNTITQGIWVLESFSSSAGVVTALWRAIAPIKTAATSPTSSDYQYPLGQIWANTATGTIYMLAAISGTTATWDSIAGPTTNAIDSITGDSGGAVTGDAVGNVNLLGTSGQVVVTGNPGTNTLTISLAGGGTAVDTVGTDSGNVTPDASGKINLLGQATPSTSGVRFTGSSNTISGTMFSPFAGDFTFIDSTVSGTRKVLVSQTDNSANSAAQIIMSVAGATAGDPSTIWTTTVTDWSAGIDNSASDAWVLSRSTALGTNNALSVSTSNALTLNSAFTFPTTDGSANQVLTTNGSGTVTWQSNTATAGVVIQTFTANGTYTPTAGMAYCIIEVCGSGAGGGGAATAGAGGMAAGGGGGAGGYARGVFTAATVGASQAVTVGTGGAGGTAGANNGSSGNTSSVGALISASGGSGGTGSAQAGNISAAGGAGGTGTGGSVNIPGGTGAYGYGWWSNGVALANVVGGYGGASYFGSVTHTPIIYDGSTTAFAGVNGALYGSGGSGALTGDGGTQQAGGNGAAGIVIITEYL